MAKIVGVRFSKTSKIYYFAPENENATYEVDSGVIVETAQGLEYGKVVYGVREIDDEIHLLAEFRRQKRRRYVR